MRKNESFIHLFNYSLSTSCIPAIVHRPEQSKMLSWSLGSREADSTQIIYIYIPHGNEHFGEK